MPSSTLFSATQFGKPNGRRYKKGRYLVFGFDTEYQRRPRTNAAGKVEIENEVLSYQFSCRVVTPDNAREEPHWSGIILPDGPLVSDRLSLDAFVTHALAEGIKAYPDVKMPVDIYLVAHFTRADVPAFNDFKDDERRGALKLDNIRSLFMNVSSDIEVSLPCDDGKGHVRIAVI